MSKKDKITLALRNADKLRTVSALTSETASDLVDRALDEMFERAEETVQPSREELEEMLRSAHIAKGLSTNKSLPPRREIQGNSTVLDSLLTEAEEEEEAE